MVVLVGFSTAGKSSIVRDAISRWEGLNTLDSDQEIARGYSAGGVAHVFAIYSQLGRENALKEISQRENHFLSRLGKATEPLLVAAGPGTVIRDQWAPFVERVSPTIVFIRQTAEQAYSGLRKRRAEHKSSPVGYAPHFGCWDQGTTTERRGDVWVEVDEAVGLANVAREMRHLDKLYRACADKTFDKSELWKDREPALSFVGSRLGLT